jgi:signal transduction histidine kinase
MNQDDSSRRLEELRHTLEQIEPAQADAEAAGEIGTALSQIDDLNRCIQAENDEKYKFISHVTHELRLPLTSIMGYTDLLRKGVVGPVNDQQLNFLNVIRNSAERMAFLVSDLSDLSKLELGKLRIEVAALSLEFCVRDVVHTLQPKFLEKKQDLGIEIPSELPNVYADSNRLIKVLTNLLSNASMYTLEGGQVRLMTHAEDTQVRIEISDTGIGISPEEQSRLFQQFFRSDEAYVREQLGWGLGLSVVKGLVELMEGAVGVYSQVGEGSTFWFTLPIKQP